MLLAVFIAAVLAVLLVELCCHLCSHSWAIARLISLKTSLVAFRQASDDLERQHIITHAGLCTLCLSSVAATFVSFLVVLVLTPPYFLRWIPEIVQVYFGLLTTIALVWWVLRSRVLKRWQTQA